MRYYTYEGECCALRFLFATELKAMAYTQLSLRAKEWIIDALLAALEG
jgi:hypothetical protein